MCPTFRKSYGPTRAQDRVLIEHGQRVRSEYECIMVPPLNMDCEELVSFYANLYRGMEQAEVVRHMNEADQIETASQVDLRQLLERRQSVIPQMPEGLGERWPNMSGAERLAAVKDAIALDMGLERAPTVGEEWNSAFEERVQRYLEELQHRSEANEMNNTMRQLRDLVLGFDPAQALPAHGSTPENAPSAAQDAERGIEEQVQDLREENAELTYPDEIVAAIIFDDERKPLEITSVREIPALSHRHAAWLNELAQKRPDAFALKQRLAQEAKDKL